MKLHKLYANIFYWVFLRKTTIEFYDLNIGYLPRCPNEIGKKFYEVYNYLQYHSD
jgi:hypothetical protein